VRADVLFHRLACRPKTIAMAICGTSCDDFITFFGV
jgi:hypothetical protein